MVLLSGILTLSYPFLVYFGLEVLQARHIALIALGLLAIRAFTFRDYIREQLAHTWPIVAIMVFFFGLSAILNDELYILFLPALVHFALLLYFASTFFRPPVIIERFARAHLGEPFPKLAELYCRWVTGAWCLFFATNASISLYTVYSGDKWLWTIYNGLISWIALAAFVGIEYACRCLIDPRVKREQAKLSPRSE